MNFRPLSDNVLVKPIEKSQTKGSILLPDSSHKKPERGEVVAVGHGRYSDAGHLIPMTVKVGDTVIFDHHSTHKIEDHDTTYYLMSETAIYAIIG